MTPIIIPNEITINIGALIILFITLHSFINYLKDRKAEKKYTDIKEAIYEMFAPDLDKLGNNHYACDIFDAASEKYLQKELVANSKKQFEYEVDGIYGLARLGICNYLVDKAKHFSFIKYHPFDKDINYEKDLNDFKAICNLVANRLQRSSDREIASLIRLIADGLDSSK